MKCKTFIYLFLLVPFSFLMAQMETNNSAAYVWFDNAIGVENSGLYIGREYTENYKFKNGKHKFFEFNGFQKGDVLYDGQPYYDVLLKFDVYENELLVKLPVEKGIAAFTLIKDEVTHFTIGNNRFIKVHENLEKEDALILYQEVLLETINFTFLKKHSADKKTIKEGRWSYVEFLKKDSHSLLYRGKYYQIRNKRDILNIFPNYKKQLKNISKNYFNGASRDENLIQLFKELNLSLLMNKITMESE